MVTPSEQEDATKAQIEQEEIVTSRYETKRNQLEKQIAQLQEDLERQINDLQTQNTVYMEENLRRRSTNILEEENTTTDASIGSKMKTQLPKFLPGKPELWFTMLELTFAQNKVTNDYTKFAVAVNSLDARAAELVSDIILKPPLQDRYQRLRETVILRMGKSLSERMQQVLHFERIGDRTPSEFWRHLRSIVEDTAISDETLRYVWLTQLPIAVQSAVVARETDGINSLLSVADKVYAVVEKVSTSAITQINKREETMEAAAIRHDQKKSLEEQLRNLQLQFDTMQKQFTALMVNSQVNPQNEKAGGHLRNQQKQVPERQEEKICWYHKRFGVKATRCTLPCEYPNGFSGL